MASGGQNASVDELRLRVALEDADDRGRHELSEAIKSVRDDLRRDIKLYVGLGVACGNGIAAVVISRIGPGSSVPNAAHAVRHLLGL